MKEIRAILLAILIGYGSITFFTWLTLVIGRFIFNN